MFGKRIVDFGNHFKGRLEQDLLNGALDYVKFNEETLSLDILCDHLSEYDIIISQKEYDEVSSLIKDMGLDESESPYKYLKALIK
ncbi:MafI family immunity protein [Utexia brackfieldae]|uniref:MafI family immunity protein n=1 Tax=Utexia brackfieldae TaxID=3074108 RepID=UPI00370DD80C